MAKRRRGGGGQRRQPQKPEAEAQSAADDAAPEVDPEAWKEREDAWLSRLRAIDPALLKCSTRHRDLISCMNRWQSSGR